MLRRHSIYIPGTPNTTAYSYYTSLIYTRYLTPKYIVIFLTADTIRSHDRVVRKIGAAIHVEPSVLNVHGACVWWKAQITGTANEAINDGSQLPLK